SIVNKNDFEAYSELLRAENIRMEFYEKLTAFSIGLKVALSSIDFHNNTGQEVINRYKNDLTMFLKLRSAVQERYSDTIDYKQYEGQIQKLIDKHIESSEVKVITELVNIFDKDKFAEEVEKVVGKAAKADTIASRTAKYINENMDSDPAFYKKFSELLKETISAYEQGRIDQAEYLVRITELMDNVLTHTDSDIPSVLQHNEAATAYFGLSLEVFKLVAQEDKPIDLTKLSLDTALEIDRIIRAYIFDEDKLVIDWIHKGQIIGKMKLAMEDYLIDEVKRKQNMNITFENIDSITNRSVEVAKKRFTQ
ncbi:MAG: type I restriction enzyme endonuclease domain-containing protein, partial [Bacteroidales bacterium]